MTKNLKRFQLLAAALLVSFSLQLVTLSKWSVWHDEGYTAMLIRYSAKDVIRRTSYDVHPPLYYLVLQSWQALFGGSDVALRMMSVMFMLLTIVMTYLLIRKLLGEKVAAWSLLPLAIAPVMVRYGQEMRMYAMVSFIGVSATYILLTLLRDGRRLAVNKRRILTGLYTLLILALLYSHYFSSFIAVTHWLMVIGYLVDTKQVKAATQLPKVLWSKEWRWWLVSYAVIVLGFLPWLPAFITQLDQVSSGFWINDAGVHSFFSTLASFVLFRPVWMNWELTQWYAVLTFIASAVCFVIFRATWRGYRSWLERALLIGYFVVPPVLLFILSMPPRNSVYYDRYLVVYAPLFFAALGIGLSELSGKSKRLYTFGNVKMPLVGVILVLLLGFGLFNAEKYGNNYGHSRDNGFAMKQLAPELRRQYMTGDAVVADNLGQYFNAWFYVRDFAGEPLLFAPGQPGKYGNTSLIYDRPDLLVQNLAQLKPQTKTVWVITSRESTNGFIENNVPPSWGILPGQVSRGDATLTGFHIAE